MAAPSVDPRDLRRDGADERVVLAHEHSLSISQQGKGAVAVPDSQAKLCVGHPRPVSVLGQAGVVSEVVTLSQMIGRSSRSSHSSANSVMPTCMSAAPRRTVDPSVAIRKPCS